MTFEARDSAAKVVPATTANNVDETVTAQKVYNNNVYTLPQIEITITIIVLFCNIFYVYIL